MNLLLLGATGLVWRNMLAQTLASPAVTGLIRQPAAVGTAFKADKSGIR